MSGSTTKLSLVMIGVAAVAVILVAGAVVWPRGYEKVEGSRVHLTAGQSRTLRLGVRQAIPYEYRILSVEGQAVSASIVTRSYSFLEKPSPVSPGGATGEVGLRLYGSQPGQATVTTAFCSLRRQDSCQEASDETRWTVSVT